MMKTVKIGLVAVGFSLALVSCSSNEKVEEQVIENVEEHDHDSEIVLNHGEKWKVDSIMMIPIKSMDKAISGFKGETLDECMVLSKSVEQLIDELTSNCTMTGQAHDELHKWLLPFIELSDNLASSDSDDEAVKNVTEMKHQITVFHTYFE